MGATKHLYEILPKITQWQAIPYAADLCCQDCEKTGFPGLPNFPSPYLVGWCETNYGFQAVFECPECGSKFRFHAGDPIDGLEDFDAKLYLIFAKDCLNWNELKQQLYE